MTVKEHLIKSKALIEKKGWRNYSKRGQNLDGFCVWTSMIWTKEGPVISATMRFQEANNITDPVTTWNDRPDRTMEEVLAAFDKAIAYGED